MINIPVTVVKALPWNIHNAPLLGVRLLHTSRLLPALLADIFNVSVYVCISYCVAGTARGAAVREERGRCRSRLRFLSSQRASGAGRTLHGALAGCAAASPAGRSREWRAAWRDRFTFTVGIGSRRKGAGLFLISCIISQSLWRFYIVCSDNHTTQLWHFVEWKQPLSDHQATNTFYKMQSVTSYDRQVQDTYS